MRYLILLPCLLCACATPGPVEPEGDQPSGLFGEPDKKPEAAPESKTTIVVDTNDVAQFRGVDMARMLKEMDLDRPERWSFVRRHVHPAPQPPAEIQDGRVTRSNYDWPPRDTSRLSPQQRAWRSYLLWPSHVRDMLHAADWDSPESRRRLALIGRAYQLTWDFHKAPPRPSERDESNHFREYAESMLACGTDGESLLVANMITALTNPSPGVVKNAQGVLIQVDAAAIEPLCAAMWVGFRQAAMLDTGEVYVQPNTNFNKYVIETLHRIGPRVVPQAIFELENSLDNNGKATGSAWRFRKHFVELLGRLGDPRALPVLEAEISRVEVVEYDEEALSRGRQVVDPVATDDAAFAWREHLLHAFAGIPSHESLRGIIRIWKLDADHDHGAIEAIRRATNRSPKDPPLRSIAAAEELARTLNVDLEK